MPTSTVPLILSFARPSARPLAYVLVGLLLLNAPPAIWGQNAVLDQTAQAAKADKLKETSHFVTLTVDFGDGFTMTYAALPWRDGITVLEAMLVAEKHAHPLVFRHRGAQETAFLTAIHGTENQGGDGRNWIFRVNGKIAKQSFGLTQLAQNDSVSWHYKGHDGGADETDP